ncbi:hypothetical protein Tco_0678358 [Tanacetum coccineum]|uniref:Uncharacterized protein n=1 Tax=Tanacetum coccineum TaxID=301880 RepID=A0ABQ4XF01_9ASTR
MFVGTSSSANISPVKTNSIISHHGFGRSFFYIYSPSRAVLIPVPAILVLRNGKVLNEEELEFLADPGIIKGPVTQTVITHNAMYQADDLDTYDSDCDNFSTAKAVLMANLTSYGLDVLSEHLLETQNAAVHDTNSSAQQYSMILSVFEQLLNQVTNCNKVNKDNLIANESLSAKLERYKERVKLLEERQNVDLSTREKLIMDDIIWENNTQFADYEKEMNYLKQTLSGQSKEKELLTKTFNVFKNKSKEKEAKNIDKEIALEKKFKEQDNIVCKMGQSAQTVHMLTKPQVFYGNNRKQALGFQNPFYLKKVKQIRPMLYDGSVIAKETNVISIADSKETLILKEESRSKMLLKQSDPMVIKQKVNIKPINYAELNRLSEDFVKHFVPQQELSDEQAFRLQTLHPNTNQFGKGFCHNSIKYDLRTFKEKDIVDNAAQASNATTIASGMYKLDPVTLAPEDKNNRITHIYYLKHTMEQAVILTEIVEQSKSLNPLDSVSYSACKYVKLIQELLGYVRETCPDIHKPNKKLVAVTPINEKKTVSSMFDSRHELCFLEFVSDMNARRTFTLDGNACPLTKITATNKVPFREPIPLKVVAQEYVVTKVYTRRPKVPKTNGSNSNLLF